MSANDFYYAIVPSLQPRLWIFIHTSLAIYTLLLALYIIEAIDIEGERPEAAALYKLWNFGTTIIWCMKAGLESWWSYMSISIEGLVTVPAASTTFTWFDKLRNSDRLFTNVLEVTLAIYVLIDSVILLWEWEIKGDDLQMSLFNVSLNLAGFTYAMILDGNKLMNARQDEVSPLEKATYTEIE